MNDQYEAVGGPSHLLRIEFTDSEAKKRFINEKADELKIILKRDSEEGLFHILCQRLGSPAGTRVETEEIRIDAEDKFDGPTTLTIYYDTNADTIEALEEKVFDIISSVDEDEYIKFLKQSLPDFFKSIPYIKDYEIDVPEVGFC